MVPKRSRSRRTLRPWLPPLVPLWHIRVPCIPHPATYHDGRGSRVLRSRQDDHQPVLVAGAVAPAVSRRDGLARTTPARRVRPTRLPARGRGRAEDGATQGGHAPAHEGL